jgi:hypothetical protein
MKRKRVPITDDGRYNIVRSEGKTKSIFKSNLDGKTARDQLKHWKNMARNSGGRVFFDLVPVPADLAAAVSQPAAA